MRVLTVKLQGNALFFLSKNNKARRISHVLMSSGIFETVIILLIVASSIMLAIDNPLMDPEDPVKKNLKIVDSIFTLEAILKILALGFWINGKFSYMRNSWNVADFLIVIISVRILTNL
jgi:voltage-dependent calcium channel L type alpha-1F